MGAGDLGLGPLFFGAVPTCSEVAHLKEAGSLAGREGLIPPSGAASHRAGEPEATCWCESRRQLSCGQVALPQSGSCGPEHVLPRDGVL